MAEEKSIQLKDNRFETILYPITRTKDVKTTDGSTLESMLNDLSNSATGAVKVVNGKFDKDVKEFTPIGYKTKDTSNLYANQWTKIMHISITKVYNDASVMVNMTSSGSGSAINPTCNLFIRLKQQSPMGQAPYGYLGVYNCIGITPDCFKLIVTKNDIDETIGELWVQHKVTYNSLLFSPTTISKTGGTVTWFDNQDYQENPPEATVVFNGVNVSDAVISNNLTTTTPGTCLDAVQGKVLKDSLDTVAGPITDDFINSLFNSIGDESNPLDYYTKSESDSKFVTKIEVDNKFYSKTDSDAKYATKDEIGNVDVDLSGLATKEEVNALSDLVDSSRISLINSYNSIKNTLLGVK